MDIGDIVVYRGRRYVLLGLDPISVDEQSAEVEDVETGSRMWVPLDELDAAPE